jgi:epoxyqueuosine reductase
MRAELLAELSKHGYQGRIVSIQRLSELKLEIQGRYRQGLVDGGLYREYLARILAPPPTIPLEPRSVLVAAVPQPQVRVAFAWEGKTVPLIIPPTYLWARKIDKRVRDVVAQVLNPADYWVAAASLPKKLLAVRSGLAAYGRNNLAYVAGMGSYHRLVALYSDLPCDDDTWQPVRMLPRCEACSACVRRCPGAAITTERFLLHAERCITFHNEKDSSVPFPSWFEARWQSCLVGCMRCQDVCPENGGTVDCLKDGLAFSQQETALLLSGRRLEQFPSAAAQKLLQSEMAGFLEVMPRSLHACLEQPAP